MILRGCALALVLAVTSCSGGSGDTERPALTKDTAAALAATGVLTAEDLPGYAVAAQAHEAADDANEQTLATCLKTSAPTFLARDHGRSFTKGQLEIDSSVDVASSVAMAKEQLTALTSSRAADCLRASVTAVLGASGLTVTSFTATPKAIDVPGADGAFAYELEFAADANGLSVALSGFETGSIVGQTEVDVSVVKSGPVPFTLDQTVALLTTATTRVAKAAGS